MPRVVVGPRHGHGRGGRRSRGDGHHAAARDARPTGQGASVRRLLAGLPAIGVPDDTGATADVDTWEDAREQERRLAAGAPAVPGAPPAGTPDDGRRPR